MSRPNFIVILVDGHFHDCFGFAANPNVLTPYLDGIAKLGVSFRQVIGSDAGSVWGAEGSALDVLGKQLESVGYTFARFSAEETAPEGEEEISRIGTQAVRFLQSRLDPFFLYIHFSTSVEVDDLPQPWAGKYAPNRIEWPVTMPGDGSGDAREQLARYYGSISFIDSQIGRVLAMLSAHSHTNNVLIYTGTRGHVPGRPALEQSNDVADLESCLRVPLIVSGVGGQERGVFSDACAEHEDLVPTLLDLAGLPVDKEVEGKSLIPLLRGEQKTLRKASLSMVGEDACWVRNSEYTLIASRTGGLRSLHVVGENGLLETESCLGVPAHIKGQMLLSRELSRMLKKA